MKPLRPIALAALLASCHSSPAPVAPTPVAPSQPPAQPAELDAAIAPVDAASVTASDDVPVDAPRVVTPHETLLRAVAAGTTPVADVIDPARGLTRVTYIEAPPSGEGRETIATHRLCGAAIARSAADVRRDVSAALEQAAAMESFECANDMCLVTGMEYAPTWRIYFARGDGGPLRIESIVQMSEAAMNEAWIRRATTYVDRARAAQRSPCPRR